MVVFWRPCAFWTPRRFVTVSTGGTLRTRKGAPAPAPGRRDPIGGRRARTARRRSGALRDPRARHGRGGPAVGSGLGAVARPRAPAARGLQPVHWRVCRNLASRATLPVGRATPPVDAVGRRGKFSRAAGAFRPSAPPAHGTCDELPASFFHERIRKIWSESAELDRTTGFAQIHNMWGLEFTCVVGR